MGFGVRGLGFEESRSALGMGFGVCIWGSGLQNKRPLWAWCLGLHLGFGAFIWGLGCVFWDLGSARGLPVWVCLKFSVNLGFRNLHWGLGSVLGFGVWVFLQFWVCDGDWGLGLPCGLGISWGWGLPA